MRVKVVIPIYSVNLRSFEKVSLQCALDVFRAHTLVLVKPLSLDISSLNLDGLVEVECFSDDYFSSIKGYNKLMLSRELYSRFADLDYILIYQLDCYVFKDELLNWCSRGYDYMGAPWIRRQLHDNFFVALIEKAKKTWGRLVGSGQDRTLLHNKVGNGGFSLRKVSSFMTGTELLQEKIEYFNAQKQNHFFNEDVFWATEINNSNKLHFRYPDYREALGFSFDMYPKYCYKLTGELPFGCHGWSKPRMFRFWKHMIRIS